MNFLDIGFESGFHSLSAKDLALNQVVSVYYDKNSVFNNIQDENLKNMIFCSQSNRLIKLVLFYLYLTVLLLKFLLAFKVNNLINIKRDMNLLYGAIDY